MSALLQSTAPLNWLSCTGPLTIILNLTLSNSSVNCLHQHFYVDCLQMNNSGSSSDGGGGCCGSTVVVVVVREEVVVVVVAVIVAVVVVVVVVAVMVRAAAEAAAVETVKKCLPVNCPSLLTLLVALSVGRHSEYFPLVRDFLCTPETPSLLTTLTIHPSPFPPT